MITDPKKLLAKGCGRWTGEILEHLDDGELVLYNGRPDYQGSCVVIAKLASGKWLQYEWSYGSCSGCDQWEGVYDPYEYSTDTDEEKAAKAKGREATIAEWRKSATQMDADTFADFLAGCIAQKADWIVGDSYRWDDKLADVKLLLAQAQAESVGRAYDPMKGYPVGDPS